MPAGSTGTTGSSSSSRAACPTPSSVPSTSWPWPSTMAGSSTATSDRRPTRRPISHSTGASRHRRGRPYPLAGGNRVGAGLPADPALRDDARRPIPRLRPGHAAAQDAEVAGEYETRRAMRHRRDARARRARPADMPAVLVAWHGAIRVGPGRLAAATNAVALELVAAWPAETLRPRPGPTRPMPASLLERHFRRKHGSTAYYGAGPMTDRRVRGRPPPRRRRHPRRRRAGGRGGGRGAPAGDRRSACAARICIGTARARSATPGSRARSSSATSSAA